MTALQFNSNQMEDIETLGTKAGCSILVIGAVKFDPFMPWPENGQPMSSSEQFKVRISRESNLKYGFEEDEKTLAFWADQSEEAREEAFGGTVDLRDALEMYADWLRDTFGTLENGAADVTTYCHGGDFDKPIVDWTMSKLGVKSPFPYNRTRDTRGLFELAGISYKGTKHTVIEDCLGQCAAVCRAHSILGFSRLANRLPGWLLPYEGLAFPILE